MGAIRSLSIFISQFCALSVFLMVSPGPLSLLPCFYKHFLLSVHIVGWQEHCVLVPPRLFLSVSFGAQATACWVSVQSNLILYVCLCVCVLVPFLLCCLVVFNCFPLLFSTGNGILCCCFFYFLAALFDAIYSMVFLM